MMSLLVPLGLLGLLSLAALILIYIIKPNFLTKHVSSTYVWQLALRYKRKRLPTSKIRNLLIFLCQVLIFTIAAGILAMPVITHEEVTDRNEVIAIIDSSASMYSEIDGVTRFERALNEVKDLADGVFASGGYVSVILADETPSLEQEGVSAATRFVLDDWIGEMLADTNACSYGTADIPAAMMLCEEVLAKNSSASVYLFTDTKYSYAPKDVIVKNVALADPDDPSGEWSGEWNAAILDAEADLEDIYYALTVRVACYGRADSDLTVKVNIEGRNATDSSQKTDPVTIPFTVRCEMGVPLTLIFRYGGGTDTEDTLYFDLNESQRFYSFQSIQITISEEDSFLADNNFNIYGGQKEVLRVQYASSLPNPFFTGVLQVLQNSFRDRWDIRITDVKEGDEPAMSGFDYYIFEHKMPDFIPTDGVVFLVDPVDRVPQGAGLGYRGQSAFQRNGLAFISTAPTHPVMNNIIADHILATTHKVLTCDAGYEVLMTCDGDPVLMVSKNRTAQVVVLACSVHYSNLSELPEWFLLNYNLLQYYLPATVVGNTFEVGEQIVLNGRGEELTVSGYEEPFREFPAVLTPNVPGTYTVRQTTYFGKEALPTNIYVKIPESESDICKQEDSLIGPNRVGGLGTQNDDLLIYLAAAVVFLLFAEWVLHSLENR